MPEGPRAGGQGRGEGSTASQVACGLQGTVPTASLDCTERGRAGAPSAQTSSSGTADLHLLPQALSVQGLPAVTTAGAVFSRPVSAKRAQSPPFLRGSTQGRGDVCHVIPLPGVPEGPRRVPALEGEPGPPSAQARDTLCRADRRLRRQSIRGSPVACTGAVAPRSFFQNVILGGKELKENISQCK